MELAAKEINAAGGINGAQIEYNFQDDEHDPEKAINAYNTLKRLGYADAFRYGYIQTMYRSCC